LKVGKIRTNIISKITSALFVLSFCVSIMQAQQSFVFTESNLNYNNAIDLYHKEKFAPAQQYFSKAVEEINDVHSELRIDAEYYVAICAIELFHSNAEALLKKFIEDHPESSHLVSANFNLAKFQFRKKKYEDVLDYLSEIDPADLNPDERAEYYFKKGYSHFQLDEYDQAAKYFYEIKDTDNLYVTAARYYYAHISYKLKNYQTASENFQKIAGDAQFGPLVPYYLSQIYYLQKKYDVLLGYAPAVLDSAPPKREDEIRKLIGDAYYETGKFKDAIPYLTEYISKKGGSEQDYYELGYANFQVKNYEESISAFQRSVGENDTLSQSAYYFIGEANVLMDNKRAAKVAFKNAYNLAIDEEITEESLFNYAKIAYELSYHPYDDAILAFEDFINNYPNSALLNDAYEYLVGVYYTTKNYEKALKSIDRIKRSDIKLLRAKQRLAYYRGVELFNDNDFVGAIEMFDLSLKHNYEPKLKASAIFWQAECFYRVGDYHNADNLYSDFLMTSGSLSLPFYNKAYYNLAYSYYEREKYKSAIFWFREYAVKADQKNKGLINDSYLRIGDSYYIQKDYRNAIDYYDKAAELSLANSDYASLQSAICSGILGDYQGKSKKLSVLINDWKDSPYIDDAIYEYGKTQINQGKDAEALSYYNQLINDYPKSNYITDTYLKVGLIHYNRKEDDLALNAFDKLVKDYPSSDAAKEALEKINKIFIEKGDAEAYKDYIKGVPFADISQRVLDSTSYVIAENGYLAGKCERATRDFTNYIKQYPEGIYKLNAHFYRGDCEAKSGFHEEAIQDFEYVITQAKNRFTIKTLISLGELYKIVLQNDSAISAYNKLKQNAERQKDVNLANQNLMQLHFQEEDFQQASAFAYEILNNDAFELPLKQKAHLILAKTSFEKENYGEVILQLKELYLESNEIAAEAKYLLAKTYYLQGKYLESDSIIYLLVDQVPSYPYWIAKGFILLADNFIAKEDLYNARITFQSVVDNSENEELIEIAKEKLDLLNKADQTKKEEEKKEAEEIEIDFGEIDELLPEEILQDSTQENQNQEKIEKEVEDE